MRKILLFLPILLLLVWLISGSISQFSGNGKKFTTETFNPADSLFILRKGDLLARPNWRWMPGSYGISHGRMYGHVALVTEGATGRTPEEALRKARVVEAFFFDQGNRKFEFDRKKQIREAFAAVSFSNRFKGNRYRLRANLGEKEIELMTVFTQKQIGGSYNIISLKKQFSTDEERKKLMDIKRGGWHCATLVWEAFYLSAGIDIDSNGGLFIYPSDIIPAPCFNTENGRLRF